MAPALPFPVLVVSYAINGLGVAMQDAQANGFVASFDTNAEAKMGILHAVYGAGALCSPIVSTQFAQMKHWSFFYLTSLGLAIINTIVLVYIFRFKSQDECLREAGQVIPERLTTEQSTNDKSTFRQILGHKTVHLLAFYILVYVGVEVTIGSWIVTYIIQERHGGPSSGYISAGFFGGKYQSLLWVNEKVGERRVIFLYVLLVIGLEIVVWFVPSLIGNAVAVSFVGVLLGPMYPLAMNHAGRVLPRWILTGSIGWIAGFGQAGSALVPFMTGAISSKYGIKSLQPLLVAMMGALIIMKLFTLSMFENTLELEVRRETLQKQVPGELLSLLEAVDMDEGDVPTVERPAKTQQQVMTAHRQLVALCVPLFLAGWNDGTTGPLLPRIQSVYNVLESFSSPFLKT
ncbi:hypothetical protein C0995_003639 [Termitomyces sp. Mi166|nr:hypothetical protein C0995_003639 [Termitomyces sp. Mi166\